MKGAPVKSRIKLSIEIGKTTLGPKVASVLGPRGIAMPKFYEAFKKMTDGKYKIGDSVIVTVVMYKDKPYDLFVSDAPTVSDLLKQAACLMKGASNSGKEIVSKINKSIITEIAKRKMSDMKINKLRSAEKMVLGTARSMGIEVEDLQEYLEED